MRLVRCLDFAVKRARQGGARRIQVTEPLARAVAGEWEFEDRGLIEVKGQGPMRTFLLAGRRINL